MTSPDGPRLFTDDAAIRHVGHGLLDRSLPSEQWTHEAHLAACLWIVTERPDIDPDREMRAIISGYNETVGGVNDDHGGYHDTITHAFIAGVRRWLARTNATALLDRVNGLLVEAEGQRDWPLRSYSRERLFSVEARRNRIEPDLHRKLRRDGYADPAIFGTGAMYESKPPSSAGRKGWSIDALFGRGADTEAAPAAPALAPEEPVGENDLFTRIGAFLRGHRLDPTPVNYDLAYQYLSGNDPIVVVSVEAAIARDGRLLGEVAQKIAELASNQVSPELLEKLIDQAHQSMTLAASLVGQSRNDASAYGTALDRGATAIDKGGEFANRALELMVEVTRTMIGKTQDAERRLAEMGDKMESLQGNLAEAQAVAETDPLTGLANRRAFQSRLDKAMAQAKAEDTPLSVAFCDIDFFKKINDNHGHDTGDRILKMVAEALAEGVGEDAFVGRFGGEEFLVLFDGIMARRAAMRVDEIRDELSGRHLVSKTTGEHLGTITFSAGVAQLLPGENDGDMLKRADEALYGAKNGGRNRVVIHGED